MMEDLQVGLILQQPFQEEQEEKAQKKRSRKRH